MPSQILIAEKILKEEHGKVYGAHFAWSHLWWAIAYPIPGFTGGYLISREFLICATLSMGLYVVISTLFYNCKQVKF